MLGDTMRFETLMVDDALRDFALRRAELVASAGAIPYLVEMCCGPEVRAWLQGECAAT